MDLDATYQVIRAVAVTRGLLRYDEFWQRYESLTGTTAPVEPIELERAIEEINGRLLDADPKAPPIGALVVLSGHHKPRDAFWNSGRNTPPRPRAASEGVWQRIVAEVHDYDWPPTLP